MSAAMPNEQWTLQSASHVLGVPMHATETEVRRKYRALILQIHPDKGGDPLTFHRTREAFAFLSTRFVKENEQRIKLLEKMRATKGWADKAAATMRKTQEQTTEDHLAKDEGQEVTELREGVEDSYGVVPGADAKRLGDEAMADGDAERALQLYDAATSYARIDAGAYAELYACRAMARIVLGGGGADGADSLDNDGGDGDANWHAAADDAARACAQRPAWVPPLLLRARACARLGRWSAARAAADRARELVRAVPPPIPGTAPIAWTVEGVCALADRIDALAHAERCVATCEGGTSPIVACACSTLSARWDPVLRTGVADGDGDIDSETPPTQRLASVDDTGVLRIYRLHDGELEARVQAHNAAAVSLAWCPDGSGLLLTAGRDGRARIWDASAGGAEAMHSLEGHLLPLTFACFDRHGGVVATTSEDCTACVWDVATGALLLALAPLHKRMVTCACFSPSGRQLVTGSDDMEARVWDLVGDVEAPGECVHTLGWESGAITDVAYTPCARLILTSTHHPRADKNFYRVLVWSAVSGRLCRWYDGHNGTIVSWSWHPNPEEESSAHIMATASHDGTIRLWDIAGEPSGAGKHTLLCDAYSGAPVYRSHSGGPQMTGAPSAVAYRPNVGDVLAVASVDGAVRLLEGETLELFTELAPPRRQAKAVTSLCWSAEGDYLATADEDGLLRVWRAPEVQEED